MPLDQAVLEHQVVGGVPAEEGDAPLLDVVVVAARRDMVSSFVEPIRRAGLEPVGDRPLRLRDDPGPRRRRPRCRCGRGARAAPRRGRPLLQHRRRHQPRRGARAGRAYSPASPTPASRRSASASHGPRSQCRARRPVALHVGLERPLEEIEGDGATVADARSALEEGVSTLLDELRLSLDYYGAQEGAVPVGRIVLAGPGKRDSRSPSADAGRPRGRGRRGPPAGARRAR